MMTYLKKFIYSYIVYVFLFIFHASLRTLASLMFIPMVDNIVKSDLSNFINIMFIIIALWITSILFDYLSKNRKADLIKKMNNSIRTDISKRLSDMNYEDYHKREDGVYVSWYSNDINTIEKLGYESLFDISESFVMMTVSIAALVYIHISLAIAALLLGIIMVLFPNIFNHKIKHRSSDVSNGNEEFIKNIKDIISGYDVLKTLNLTDLFKDKIIGYSANIEEKKYIFNKFITLIEALIFLANITCQLIITAFTGALSIYGIIPVGSILTTGNYSSSLYNSLEVISKGFIRKKSTYPIFEKISKSEHYDYNKIPIQTLAECIDVENLNYSYGSKQVLNGVNLKFEIGKKYALTGKSGSGKTTLVKILLGQLEGYSGTIAYDGTELSKINTDSVLEQVAYIDQNVYLFNTTILDNILLSRKISDDFIKKIIQKCNLTDVIDSMKDGINAEVGERGSNLSGGQRQRIAIARALAGDKKIIIVDEGTSALDKKNAEEIENLLVDDENLTLIMISHKINEDIEKKLDKIYNLDELPCATV